MEKAQFYNDISVDQYMEEIKNYPLLTTEEQKKYGKDLKKINDVSFLYFDKYMVKVNFEKLFGALALENINEDILNKLKVISKLLNVNDKQTLEKYCELVKNKQQFLNIQEIKVMLKAKDVNEYKMDISRELDLANDYLVARKTMIESNLRLVVKEAKEAFYQKNNTMDIIEEGNIGLLIAVNKFDVDLDNRFSTYAIWWIRQAIRREYYRTMTSFGVSERHISMALKIRKEVEKNKVTTGKTMSFEEIAEKFNISYDDIVMYTNMIGTPFSIDQPLEGYDQELTVRDIIADENIDIDNQVLNTALRDEVDELLSNLNDRERFVVENRYGINKQHKCYTLEDIGKVLNVTRERIRQIERKAMAKIRVYINREEKYQDLKLYLKK